MTDGAEEEHEPGWWQASDGNWYAPELHPDYRGPEPGEPAATAPPSGAGAPPDHVPAGDVLYVRRLAQDPHQFNEPFRIPAPGAASILSAGEPGGWRAGFGATPPGAGGPRESVADETFFAAPTERRSRDGAGRESGGGGRRPGRTLVVAAVVVVVLLAAGGAAVALRGGGGKSGPTTASDRRAIARMLPSLADLPSGWATSDTTPANTSAEAKALATLRHADPACSPISSVVDPADTPGLAPRAKGARSFASGSATSASAVSDAVTVSAQFSRVIGDASELVADAATTVEPIGVVCVEHLFEAGLDSSAPGATSTVTLLPVPLTIAGATAVAIGGFGTVSADGHQASVSIYLAEATTGRCTVSAESVATGEKADASLVDSLLGHMVTKARAYQR